MSVVDRGRETVLVYPEVEIIDGRGNVGQRGPSDTPVTLRRCWVRPATAEESAVLGEQILTVYKVLTRTAPAGAWSRVVWDGRDWDVVGEPLRHLGIPALDHVVVFIRARGPQPLAQEA